MPRIPSGSYIKEINLFEPGELYTTLKELVDLGVDRVGITHEPVVIEVDVGGEHLAIAVGFPALIVDMEAEPPLHGRGRVFRVVKDAWAEYTWVKPELLAHVVKSLLECTGLREERMELRPHGNCPPCTAVTVETLALKYAQRPWIAVIDVEGVEKLVTNALKENKLVLVACSDVNAFKPLVWLTLENNVRSVHFCCPSRPEDFAPIIQALIDVVASSP
ncbi:MAG: hypothetical protein QXJ26_03845 [Desulfurococcaceae archaeon]